MDHAMDDAMEDGMDGTMNAMDGEGMDGEGMDEMEDQEPVEEVFDVTKCPRCQFMSEKYISQLANYDAADPKTAMTPARFQLLYNFLTDPLYTKLFVYVDFKEPKELVFNYDQPPSYADAVEQGATYSFAYFIKADGNNAITLDNIESQLVMDVLEREPLDDLLNRMNSEYMNKFLGENDWPDGVKKDFIASLHNFMHTINEYSYLSKGKTNLYIPNEDLDDVDACATDKDLMQRLETTVIFWTRQIKELVSNQDVGNQGDNNTPLDEIKHWEDRNSNLESMATRLKDPKLKKIVEVLDRAQSAYLAPFNELTKEIDKGHEEANDNLQFLRLLQDPCKRIENSQPKDIPKLLPEVLSNVRIIFELSKHYNSKVKNLLTKIGNQIIRRCCKKINKDDMLNGDVEKCMRDLDESIECCEKWRQICTRSQKIIKQYSTSETEWSLSNDQDKDKDNTIFAENEAFIQRCRELKEICEG